MKNIHVLPTDKPSRLFKLAGDLHLHEECEIDPKRNQNIYITSDEEIKEGDWVFDIFKNACPDIKQLKTEEEVLGVQKTEFKIILTTDVDLIEDGVQAIDNEFLEWFVKNPSCERVEVTYGVLKPFQSEDKGYLIHCPDNEVLEEPKQETLEEADEIITTTKFSWEEDKKMYSYEEVLEQLNLLYGMKNSLVDTFTDENDYITMKWFKQFKNK